MTDIRGYYDESYPPSVLNPTPPTPPPVVTLINPSSGVVDTADLLVTVTATNLQANSFVTIDGVIHPTTSVDANNVSTVYDLPSTAGTHQFGLSSGGVLSNTVPFTVTDT